MVLRHVSRLCIMAGAETELARESICAGWAADGSSVAGVLAGAPEQPAANGASEKPQVHASREKEAQLVMVSFLV